MKQSHDTQVGRQVLVRNIGALTSLAADKGYDWESLRTKLRAEGIRSLIRSEILGYVDGREICSSMIGRITFVRTLNRCFWDCVVDTVRRSGRETGSANSPELVMNPAVRDIERAIEDSSQ